jgi:uncharacterized protein YkwD
MDAILRRSALWLIAALFATERTAGASGTDAWADATSSPVALDATKLDPLAREALSKCGAGEAGLRNLAEEIASRKVRGLPMPKPDAIASAQRAAGEPHPWARAWAASAKALASETTLPKLDAWLAESPYPELRRCAVARTVAPDGTQVLAVVAVDALADLRPIPTRGRTGQWLTVEARLLVPATGGNVVVLGPSGAPRHVPTWFDGTTLHARFALDRPGAFAVQVVASTASGPRPVLEASVFADVDPFTPVREELAPGEDSADSRSDDDGLARMLSAARASAGEPALSRDARLDAIARQHAERMSAARTLAHDAGDGDPAERMRSAGLDARTTGENIAHAATVPLAHRALWASPSHRANMLRREFDRVGVGVVRDERGDAWVVETFAEALRP